MKFVIFQCSCEMCVCCYMYSIGPVPVVTIEFLSAYLDTRSTTTGLESVAQPGVDCTAITSS